MKEPVIYKIRNVVNGKFYVGSTTDTRERFRNHRKMLRGNRHHCRHLQASWNKYGEDCFKFDVQEVVEDATRLWEAEERWLADHFGKDYCYNSGRAPEAPMRGRFGPLHPSYGKSVPQEQKEAISATLKEFYAEDPNNHPRVGKQHTDETKAKISASKKANPVAYWEGKERSQETRQKIGDAQRGKPKGPGRKVSEEGRAKIQAAAAAGHYGHWAGRAHTEESKEKMRRPVYAILPDGSRQDFPGTALAGEELGVPYQMLVRTMKAQKPIAKGKLAGWLFCYADAPVEPPTPVEIPEEFKHLPRTRQGAKDKGEKHYFTGEPCKHGHIAPRLTKGACTACRKAGLA
jgi:group I intron endonuclease